MDTKVEDKFQVLHEKINSNDVRITKLEDLMKNGGGEGGDGVVSA